MIMNEKIWEYLEKRYEVQTDQAIERYGIIVNEETEECIVEIYLRQVLIYPVPNNVLKFDVPKTLLISRNETILELEKKIIRLFNNRLYELKERGTIFIKLRLWKSLTNKLNEI